jgi:putative ABC transport system substrate-binding protein
MGLTLSRLIAGAAALLLAAGPLAVQAQPAAKVYRIGILAGSPPNSPEASHVWEGFFQGLRELGYVEGVNFVIEGRYYEERIERLPALAAELVRLPVDVIVAGAAPAPETAKRATSMIPIVMANHGDPVGSGLVASFARPGENVTGLSMANVELFGKRLQLLKEALPRLSRVAVLSNPNNPQNALELRAVEGAAQSLQVQVQILEARAPSEFAGVFSAATKGRADALMVLGGSMFFAERVRLAELAAKSRLPAMYVVREYAEVGGLMAYGVNLRESFRRAATYVDKILRGAKPGDLPVEQPTKFDVVVNLRTAKALGVSIPPAVLVRAETID